MSIDGWSTAETPYVDLLARLNESNRPPGGMVAVGRLLRALHLGQTSRVLHVGCNAGFLSREIVRRTGAEVVGVDINPQMIEAASRRARQEGLADRLSYIHADMGALDYGDGQFDVVLSAGALAFVQYDHREAVREWSRVCRPHGLLADVEMYYSRPPPASLRIRVSQAIGVEVPCYEVDHWLNLFVADGRELYDIWHLDRLAKGEASVRAWVKQFVAWSMANGGPDDPSALSDRLERDFLLFDENLSYLSAVGVVVINRPAGFEPSLYP